MGGERERGIVEIGRWRRERVRGRERGERRDEGKGIPRPPDKSIIHSNWQTGSQIYHG
jgi:hypothetical protein